MRGALMAAARTDRRGHVKGLEHVLCPSAAVAPAPSGAAGRPRLSACSARGTSSRSRARPRLQEQLTLRQTAEDENGLLKMATSLWSDDELSGDAGEFRGAAEDAEAAVDVEGQVLQGARAVVIERVRTAERCLAVLDSLKRELHGSARPADRALRVSRLSDALAEQRVLSGN